MDKDMWMEDAIREQLKSQVTVKSSAGVGLDMLDLRSENAHLRFRLEALEAYSKLLLLLCRERGMMVPEFPKPVE